METLKENYLLYFKHQQKGWKSTELLLYPSFEEAVNDLRQVAYYSVLANRMGQDESRSVLEQFDKSLGDYPTKFKLKGNYDSWQAELIDVDYEMRPFKELASGKGRLYVLHREGLHDAWKIQLFDNLDDGKERFRSLAELYINQEVNCGMISKSDASVTRSTLDQYMREGNYKWNFRKDKKVYEFDLKSYKVKDLRKDKETYLDGQDRSVFLGILEAYKKNERFFATPAESRWANREEKVLDSNRTSSVPVDLDTGISGSVWVVEHEITKNGVEPSKIQKKFETASEGIAFMHKLLEKDLEKFMPAYESSDVIKERFEQSCVPGFYVRPRYSFIGITKDHDEISVYCDMGLVRVLEKEATRIPGSKESGDFELPVSMDCSECFTAKKSKVKER